MPRFGTPHDGWDTTVLGFGGVDAVATLPGVDDVDLSRGFDFDLWAKQTRRSDFPRLFERASGMLFYIQADGTLKANVNTTAG